METYKNIPKLSTIERIAEALNVPVLDLFQENSETKEEAKKEKGNRVNGIFRIVNRFHQKTCRQWSKERLTMQKRLITMKLLRRASDSDTLLRRVNKVLFF